MNIPDHVKLLSMAFNNTLWMTELNGIRAVLFPDAEPEDLISTFRRLGTTKPMPEIPKAEDLVVDELFWKGDYYSNGVTLRLDTDTYEAMFPEAVPALFPTPPNREKTDLEAAWLPTQKTVLVGSKTTGDVPMEPSILVKSFMDVEKWKTMHSIVIDAIRLDSGGGPLGQMEIAARLELPSGLTPVSLGSTPATHGLIPMRHTTFTRTCHPVGGDRGDEGWLVMDTPIPSRVGQEELPYVRSFMVVPAKTHGFSRVIILEIGLIYKSHSQTESDPNYDGTHFWSRRWFSTLSRECNRLRLRFPRVTE
ncbi:hypothetical protein HA466_0261860 [Hirschfeldia incana]|nr:hypothetical protein HA466_0261860 [Hirschfeldia incana]